MTETEAHRQSGYPSWVFEAYGRRVGTDAPEYLYQEGSRSPSPPGARNQGGGWCLGRAPGEDREEAAHLWALFAPDATGPLPASAATVEGFAGKRSGSRSGLHAGASEVSCMRTPSRTHALGEEVAAGHARPLVGHRAVVESSLVEENGDALRSRLEDCVQRREGGCSPWLAAAPMEAAASHRHRRGLPQQGSTLPDLGLRPRAQTSGLGRGEPRRRDDEEVLRMVGSPPVEALLAAVALLGEPQPARSLQAVRPNDPRAPRRDLVVDPAARLQRRPRRDEQQGQGGQPSSLRLQDDRGLHHCDLAWVRRPPAGVITLFGEEPFFSSEVCGRPSNVPEILGIPS